MNLQSRTSHLVKKSISFSFPLKNAWFLQDRIFFSFFLWFICFFSSVSLSLSFYASCTFFASLSLSLFLYLLFSFTSFTSSFCCIASLRLLSLLGSCISTCLSFFSLPAASIHFSLFLSLPFPPVYPSLQHRPLIFGFACVLGCRYGFLLHPFHDPSLPATNPSAPKTQDWCHPNGH